MEMINWFKKHKVGILWIVGICIAIITIRGLYVYKHPPVSVEFRELPVMILSVNDNILNGKWVGNFLSSSSGYIRDDGIIVGVKYSINDVEYLDDFELYHSEVAAIDRENGILMELVILTNDNAGPCAKIKYNHRVIISKHYRNITRDKDYNWQRCVAVP